MFPAFIIRSSMEKVLSISDINLYLDYSFFLNLIPIFITNVNLFSIMPLLLFISIILYISL